MSGLDELDEDLLGEIRAHVRAWSKFKIERESVGDVTSAFAHVERVRGLPENRRMRTSLVRRAIFAGNSTLDIEKLWVDGYAIARPCRRKRRGDRR